MRKAKQLEIVVATPTKEAVTPPPKKSKSKNTARPTPRFTLVGLSDGAAQVSDRIVQDVHFESKGTTSLQNNNKENCNVNTARPFDDMTSARPFHATVTQYDMLEEALSPMDKLKPVEKSSTVTYVDNGMVRSCTYMSWSI